MITSPYIKRFLGPNPQLNGINKAQLKAGRGHLKSCQNVKKAL